MTKRIFAGAFAAAIITIIAAMALVLKAVYDNESRVFQEQIEEETRLLSAAMQFTPPETDVESLTDLSGTESRITYISPEGVVLFDNKADPASMDNHNSREEIIAARESGNGIAVRESSTLSERTVYCAQALPDGNVIRVAGTFGTVFSQLLGMWWQVLLVLILAAVLSGLFSALVAKAVVKPINNIDLSNPDINEGYGEIAPLLHCISDRNSEIARQMAELTRSREEFNLITENMSEGFIITDSKTEILSYNKAALDILNADMASGASENLQTESRSVFVLNRSEPFRKSVESALSGKHSETVLNVKDKVYRILANPVYSGETISGAVLIILDVTEKEQRETLRREFTSNVSHELKTPLTTIYGISDMLAEGMVKPADVSGFAKNIRDESGRMISLINDIIRLSQLDENNFPEERTRTEILALAQSAADRLETEAKKKHVTVQISGDRGEYCGIESVLEEVLYNLLDNAIKYNREGGRAEIEVKDGDDAVTVTVSDTGIGIPADSIDRVFERFYRVDKSHSRKIGGTGLGLSIVKHGVALHGGTVKVKSNEGTGTEITVTLAKEKT